MKKLFAYFALTFVGYSVQAADVAAKLNNVHLCCKGCVTAVEKAVAKVPGAGATASQDTGVVELKAADNATLQKAADAVLNAGYFGSSSDSKIKMDTNTGVKGEKVQSLQVSGVHLCCGKCAGAVDEALKTVPGVKSHTAAKGVESFEVKGDFKDSDVFAALNKAGLSGKAK